MVFSWRRFRKHVTHVLHLDETPPRLAASMAVGVFIGVTPFYGLHTALALAAAFAFRLNKAATITGAWINLPWFAPFVYAFSLKLGEAILAGDLTILWGSLGWIRATAATYAHASAREHVGHFVQILWDVMFTASKPLLVGTTVVGLVGGALTYVVTLEAVREVRRLRHRIHPVPAAAEQPLPRDEVHR